MVGGLVALAGCSGGDGDPQGYGPELRSDFVEDCTVSGTPEDVCRCYYESLASEVPFSRYEEIEARLQDGGEIPTDVADLAAACAAEPEPEPVQPG
jgi:hypothetical protein